MIIFYKFVLSSINFKDMKRIRIVMVLGLLASCASGPEKAVEKFAENLAKGKVEEAKKYATESTGKLIDMASGFGGIDVEPNYQFSMIKDSIVGNKAWVTYINQKGKEETMQVVKIDGDWLVHVESKK